MLALFLLFSNPVIEPTAAHVESGKASYYTDTRTASGEKFSKNSMTAAHKTLSFGTRVQVTHGEKSVVVRINDRGPFIKGRIIDLTPAAFKQLAPLKRGVIPVKLQVVK